MILGGFYGTEAQQRLQRKSDRLTPWIMRTPGACLTGRTICADDPDRLGWDVILDHLREDGVFSYRWIDPAGCEEIKRHTAQVGASLHQWNGYRNTADNLRSIVSEEMTRRLPDGMTTCFADKTHLTALQAFLAENGITPLSGAVHLGSICRAHTVLILDQTGAIAATGFAGMLPKRAFAFAR